MTSLVDRVDQFHPNLEHWQQYDNCLGPFLDPNHITNEGKKRSVFLLVIGLAACRLFTNLIAPAKQKQKEFDNVD